jgi:hypothetical protein
MKKRTVIIGLLGLIIISGLVFAAPAVCKYYSVGNGLTVDVDQGGTKAKPKTTIYIGSSANEKIRITNCTVAGNYTRVPSPILEPFGSTSLTVDGRIERSQVEVNAETCE